MSSNEKMLEKHIVNGGQSDAHFPELNNTITDVYILKPWT